MGRIVVLDPTVPPPDDVAGPGPEVASLAGRRAGIRIDRTWRSFEWVSDATASVRREPSPGR